MKTKVITILSAVLAALGSVAAAKYSLPQETVTTLTEAIVAVVGAGFGVAAAMHSPAKKDEAEPAK